MGLWLRIKNLWFLSGISKEDIKANPHSFAIQHVNRQEMDGKAYIAGLSEEEQTFKDSLPLDKQITIT